MQACLDHVIPYVHDRKQFGTSIGEFQLMQAKLADMYTAMNASRSYVYAVARACDRESSSRPLRKDCAGAILFAAENATQVASQAIQACGGMGYTKEFPVERIWRDAKLYEIGAGTSEIRRMLLGRELFNEVCKYDDYTDHSIDCLIIYLQMLREVKLRFTCLDGIYVLF
jgi:isovaleryl-CoA dehydrogenase